MYGYSFTAGKWYMMLVINGYMFSLYRGSNSNKICFRFYKNIWRKTKTRNNY